MKIFKRLLSLIMAIVMLVSIACAVDFSASAAPTAFATDIVSYARQFLGYEYRKGAKGPNAFDCSGFVSYVFNHFGISIPSSASTIFNNYQSFGTLVAKGSIEKAKMGDIISWSGHAAIYTEDGYVVEALGTKYGVCEKVKVNRHTNGMNYKVIRVNGVLSSSDPAVSSLTNVNSGVQVSWNKISGAEKYRVYRRTSSSGWVGLTDTASTSYVDTTAKSGTKYYYTVRCVSKDGKKFTSSYDTTGKSITFLTYPKITSLSNGASGVQISWEKLSGAEKYRVFRKTTNSGWTSVGDTVSVSFVDTTAKSGTKYAYTIRCVSKDGKTFASGYDYAGKVIDYIAAPVITSLSADNTGTIIKWNKVSGAVKYRVYRKTATTGWVGLTDTSATSFTDATSVKGTKYIYTVRCISADGKTYVSGYDAAGKSIAYLQSPKLTSVYADNAGNIITWSKVSGAESYKVFRKTGTGGWTAIGTATGTAYTDKTAKAGTKYTYTVRCVSAGGIYTSGYDTVGLSLVAVSSPVISSLTNIDSGAQISWSKVPGAELYRVYRKTATTGWVAVANTDSNSFVDTAAKSGTRYTYTVRCVTGDGKTYTSGYSTAGKSVTYLSSPKLTSVYADTAGTVITWNKVSGAENYMVFRKTGSGGWTAIGTSTGVTYTDKTAKPGTKYSYTVRCISKDGKNYTSGYDKVGMGFIAVSSPVISSLSIVDSGVQISWNKVSGAEIYRVYRKTANTGWVGIANTDSTDFIDTTVIRGMEYTYTVRCITGDGKTFASGYDAAGRSISY